MAKANNSTTVSNTAITVQPELVKFFSEQLNQLKIENYLHILKDVMENTDFYEMSKENFDNVIELLGKLTVKPIPPQIKDFLFRIATDDISTDMALDEHSYYLAITSLVNMVDDKEEKRLIKAITKHLDYQADTNTDNGGILSVLNELTSKLK
ncbi:MAG TPA: hypothetical protein PLI45_04925 [Candidatus Woesebacteria bacterium]|nr:hypothetical protein [Candidatus Woesebacteria bacterium]